MIAFIVATVACGDAPPRVPMVVLESPVAEFPRPFSSVSSLVEMSDGRVLVGDVEEKAIWLVDLSSGTHEQVGRGGNGPGEYMSFEPLLRLSRDTTLLDDVRNGRFDVFVRGRISGVPISRHELARFMMPRATDSNGRLYSQEPTAGKDSVAVLRWDARRERLDTVAYLSNKPVETSAQTIDGGVVLAARFGKFPDEDVWGVLSDGTVMIARRRPYRIDIVAPPGDAPLAPPRVSPAVAEPGASLRERLRFWREPAPPVHGVYGRRPTVSREDRFWVQRSTRDEAPEEYDTFDRSGTRVMRVVLPPSSTYVGFGERTVYVVRETRSGHVLTRYAVP